MTRTTTVKCDVCGNAGAETFYLMGRGDAKAMAGRGGIDLCDVCWTRIAKPRMRRPVEARRQTVARLA